MKSETETEYQIHKFLLAQGLISNDTQWYPQVGGRTNKVWRLVGDKDLICKLYLETNF